MIGLLLNTQPALHPIPHASFVRHGCMISVLFQVTINNLGIGRDVDETLRLLQAHQFLVKHGEVSFSCSCRFCCCRGVRLLAAAVVGYRELSATTAMWKACVRGRLECTAERRRVRHEEMVARKRWKTGMPVAWRVEESAYLRHNPFRYPYALERLASACLYALWCVLIKIPCHDLNDDDPVSN